MAAIGSTARQFQKDCHYFGLAHTRVTNKAAFPGGCFLSAIESATGLGFIHRFNIRADEEGAAASS